MIKFLTIAVTTTIVLSLFFQGIVSAGTPQKMSPVQKISPVQKMSPVQKEVPFTPAPAASQKGVTPQNIPLQKGSYVEVQDVPVPTELIEFLQRLQPQRGEPLKNIGRCIVRKVVKKKISQYIQDNLPQPPLPLP